MSMMGPLLPPAVDLMLPPVNPGALPGQGQQPPANQEAPPVALPLADPLLLLQQAVTGLSDYSVERLSSQLFCDDHQTPEAKIRSHTRRREALQAIRASKTRVKRFSSLPPARLPEAIQKEAVDLANQVQALPVGKSLIFAGSYGKRRSITQGFLKLGHLALDKNPQGLPTLLFNAFKQGAPTEEDVLQALFAIVAEKPDQWSSDPCAKCILNLILNANPLPGALDVRLNLLIGKVNDIHERFQRPIEGLVSIFSDTHPRIIPNNYGRDKLLETLVPTENSALHALFALVLPPSVATHFAEHPPQTIEDIIDPLVKLVFDHLNQQLPDQHKEMVVAALDKVVKQWSPSVRLTKILGKKAGNTTLLHRWQTLKDKHGEALLNELKNLALEVSGEPGTGFSNFLRNYVDIEIETLIDENIHALPSNIKKLLQSALLSPTGEYFVKCIRTGSNAFDVEVYASGHLMQTPEFEGKWPIIFKDLKTTDLNDAFFVGLIQHTLAREETSTFSSSTEHFKQFLLELGVPSHNASPMSYLPKSYLTPTEMLFYYIAYDLNISSISQNPAAQRLLWQDAELKRIMENHLQNGLLDKDARPHVNMLKRACRQLSATAEDISRRFPKEFEESAKDIKTTCDSAEKVCNATAKERKPETLFHLPTSVKERLQGPFETLTKILDIAQRILPLMPYAESSAQIGYQLLLNRLFKLRENQARDIYDMVRAELAIQEVNVELTARQETFIKILEASHAAFRAISFGFNTLCNLLNVALAYLLTRIPAYARGGLQHIGAVLQRDLTNMFKQMQRKMIQLMVDFMIARYCDQTLLDGFADLQSILDLCMHTNLPFTFRVPRGMSNDEHMAIEFKQQLLSFTGFTSLDHIKVVVEEGAVTAIKFTKLFDDDRELIFSRTRDNSFTHPDLGSLCPKQYHPQLSAFGSYLLVHDAFGVEHVLVRETLVSNQLVDYYGATENGSFLWNALKLCIPQSNTAGVLHVCRFPDDPDNRLPDKHLTAQTPEALLYLTRSYLVCENDKAALATFRDWENLLRPPQEMRLPDLTPHLLPFLFCSTKTAVRIRLSLFATLGEELRKEGSASKPHPLHSFLWMALSADLKTLTPADLQENPTLRIQAPLLREMIIEGMKQLPLFYTTQELAQGIKQAFHLKGEASPENLKLLFARATPLIPYIDWIAKRSAAPLPSIDMHPAIEPNQPSALARVVNKIPHVYARAHATGTAALSRSVQTVNKIPGARRAGEAVLSGSTWVVKKMPYAYARKAGAIISVPARVVKKIPYAYARTAGGVIISGVAIAVIPTWVSIVTGTLGVLGVAGVKYLPDLTITHLPDLAAELLQHTQLSPEEKDTLRLFFLSNTARTLSSECEINPQFQPPLTAETLKTRFWSYYKLFFDDSQKHNGSSHALKRPLLLLQQTLGSDAQAAVLARILGQLLWLIQKNKGDYLKHFVSDDKNAFSATSLQTILREQGIDKFIQRINTMMTEPQMILPGYQTVRKTLKTTTLKGVAAIPYTLSGLTATYNKGQKLVTAGVAKKNALVGAVNQVYRGVKHVKQRTVQGVYTLVGKGVALKNAAVTKSYRGVKHVKQEAAHGILTIIRKGIALQNTTEHRASALMQEAAALQNAFCLRYPLEGPNIDQIQQVASAVMCFYYLSYIVAVSQNQPMPHATRKPHELKIEVVPNELALAPNGPIFTEVD